MPCYHPLEGWLSNTPNPKTGKHSIVFNLQKGFADQPRTIPCGQCIGCLLARSAQWAMRIVHETQLHEHSYFLTLTYDEENIPYRGNLDKTHIPKFIRSIRQKLKKIIRYYQCGEYGDNYGRPHYHAIIWGPEITDLKPYKKNHQGNMLYTSEILKKAWGKGNVYIGDVTFESAAYVARYCLKKQTGKGLLKKDKNGLTHYQRRDTKTGEIYELIPEYATMSLKPGIGAEWFKKYKSDCYPSDTVIMRGQSMLPPKYYDNLYEKSDPELHKKLKISRAGKALKSKIIDSKKPLDAQEKNDRRLFVKQRIKTKKSKDLLRSHDA